MSENIIKDKLAEFRRKEIGIIVKSYINDYIMNLLDKEKRLVVRMSLKKSKSIL